MSLLDELESIKYISVLDLMKNDESYDKKRNVLTGEEVFKLCQSRYQMMQEILLPLKQKLGENIEIVDICFAQGMQEDTNILVRYNKDGKKNYFTISNLGFNDIEILSSDDNLEKYGFVFYNKKIILNIFNQVYEESLDSEFYIHSTSKKFIIRDSFKSFIIRDINERIFGIEGSHALYAKEGLLYDREKTIASYQKLKELLTEANILNIFNHIRVYEDDFPKTLIKKTNR